MYVFHNANSKGRFVDDCVVRAISIAEDNSWNYTYDKLSDLAQEQGTLLNDVEFVDNYLDRNYQRLPHYSTTVGELCEEYPYGTLLVTMPNHITIIDNGIVYDTFDCRKRRFWTCWLVE